MTVVINFGCYQKIKYLNKEREKLMYNPFAYGKFDSGMVLHTICEHRGTDTTHTVYTLENLTHSVLCGADFQLCFTVVRDIIPESLQGADLYYKQGSHHVLTPPADLLLQRGEKWVFRSQNIRLALEHISDAPQAVYIKYHKKSPVVYTDVHTTPMVFTDKDELAFEQHYINPDVSGQATGYPRCNCACYCADTKWLSMAYGKCVQFNPWIYI